MSFVIIIIIIIYARMPVVDKIGVASVTNNLFLSQSTDETIGL